MAVPIPLIIQGPAIVMRNGLSIYTKSPITVSKKTETFKVATDHRGTLDTRKVSDSFEISFTPAGQLTNLAAFQKYMPHLVTGVGTSIFGASPTATVIHTLSGTTHTFHRTGISKMPGIRLKATDTFFSDMTITSLNKATVSQTDAAAFSTMAITPFADTSFDLDQIKTQAVTATWGETYTDLGAMDGFEIDLPMETTPIKVDGWGIGDIVLGSVGVTCKFAPSTLSQAQWDAILGYQDEDAILPGESLAKAGNDLVLETDFMTLTLKTMGPGDAEQQFGTAQHRHKSLTFTNRVTFTTGVANSLWTFEVNE